MNDSEKRRVNAIIKNLESKNPGYVQVIGAHVYTAKQIIKELKTNPTFRVMFLEVLDQYEIAEMKRDAERTIAARAK